MVAKIGHFQMVLSLFFKEKPRANLSYENEFYLHVHENSFSYERLCTKTCFEKEVQGNSERAYYHSLNRKRNQTVKGAYFTRKIYRNDSFVTGKVWFHCGRQANDCYPLLKALSPKL